MPNVTSEHQLTADVFHRPKPSPRRPGRSHCLADRAHYAAKKLSQKTAEVEVCCDYDDLYQVALIEIWRLLQQGWQLDHRKPELNITQLVVNRRTEDYIRGSGLWVKGELTGPYAEAYKERNADGIVQQPVSGFHAAKLALNRVRGRSVADREETRVGFRIVAPPTPATPGQQVDRLGYAYTVRTAA